MLLVSMLNEKCDHTNTDIFFTSNFLRSKKAEVVFEHLTNFFHSLNIFRIINEQLYQIELKLNEIEYGEAVEYLQPLADLEENARIRTEVAGILRQFRLKNLDNEFEAEELAAKQNFEVIKTKPLNCHSAPTLFFHRICSQNEKVLLYDSVEDDLNEKIKNLEEDKNNVDLNADLWMVERGLAKTGKMAKDKKHSSHIKGGIYRDFETNPRKKPVTVSGPYIVYMLRDSEILEDWTIIKKALSNCNRKPGC